MKTLKDELIKELDANIPKEYKIIVMPHFCIDNFVLCGNDSKSFFHNIEKIANQGGGNMVVSQILRQGGKAANCTSALLSLGAQIYLIAKTDEIGYKLLEYFFEGKNADLSYVSRDGKLAFTTAIELKDTNIMLSDPGSLSQFGPEYLTDAEEKIIREADLICISDWGLNNKGTELAEYVFGIVKEKKKGKTFFDPGDPSPKKEKEYDEIEGMNNRILKNGLIDILSINEDEAKKYGMIKNLNIAINNLSKWVRVDLHTRYYARSVYKDLMTKKIPAFDIQPKRLTGAGDAWNAGDIFGEIMGLPDDLRLLLANAVAAYYISDLKGRHPTRKDLIKFLEGVSFKDKLPAHPSIIS